MILSEILSAAAAYRKIRFGNTQASILKPRRIERACGSLSLRRLLCKKSFNNEGFSLHLTKDCYKTVHIHYNDDVVVLKKVTRVMAKVIFKNNHM